MSDVSRRSFLQAGALGFAGLTLADLLRAEAAQGVVGSRKAIVNIHLDGGPPHLDMIDLKPEAPVEIRGEFQGISTRLPGLQVCELLPKLASLADKFVFIRSLASSANLHDAFQCQSGYITKDLQSVGGRPAQGCVVAKLQGSPDDSAPPFVDLMQGRPMVRDSARPGFLGPAYQAFRPDISHLFTRELSTGMQAELANRVQSQTANYALNQQLNADRVGGRMRLLRGFDRLRREVDSSGMMNAMDGFNRQALEMLTSGQFARAMDLDLEDTHTLRRYHLETSAEPTETADGPAAVRKLLLARRLIEAGVRCVSLSLSDYDTHTNNFTRLRAMLPVLDQSLYAFVTDLEERGMLDDVAIVVWGEFGRTPRVNARGGRDHWSSAAMALLAGGGMRTGQVIGQTDRLGSTVIANPVTHQDIFATLYHHLGIDAKQVMLTDPSGRPQQLLDESRVLSEVL